MRLSQLYKIEVIINRKKKGAMRIINKICILNYLGYTTDIIRKINLMTLSNDYLVFYQKLNIFLFSNCLLAKDFEI